MYKIGVMPGDGVGMEVIPAALEVLEATGFSADYVHLDVGYRRWQRDGQGIGEDTFRALDDCDCALFGAVQSPPDPEYRSVVVQMRRHFDLYACLRPVNLRGIDTTVVRENTEGLYSGIEELDDEKSTTLRVITRRASERIAAYACQQARTLNLPLTVVHKANVLKSDLLFRDTCLRVAEEMVVEVNEMIIDAAAYDMVIHPRKRRVLVTTNLFGDVLSDVAAGLAGSLGLCPSANIGDKFAIFEPTHGSAPDIAGDGVANPVGAVLSAAMMLEWMGDIDKTKIIRQAVNETLETGVCTRDLGGDATTIEFTRTIIDKINLD